MTQPNYYKHQDTKGDYNNIKEQHPSPLIVLATLARPPQAISPYAKDTRQINRSD